MDFINKIITKLNVTMILITHDMQLTLEYTDRSLILDQESIISDDNPFSTLNNKVLVNQAGLEQTSIYRLAEKMNLSGTDLARATVNM